MLPFTSSVIHSRAEITLFESQMPSYVPLDFLTQSLDQMFAKAKVALFIWLVGTAGENLTSLTTPDTSRG